MKIRTLREIEVSEIGMGCMGFSHGYGAAPSREYSIQAIQGAYEYGCTFLIQLRAMEHSNSILATMNSLWEKQYILFERRSCLQQNFTFETRGQQGEDR